MESATELLLDERNRTIVRETAVGYFGRAESKPRISWMSAAGLGVTLTCFALAVASIFSPQFAVRLGQTNQLIVVGFLLAIMGQCAQIQVRNCSFLVEARFGKGTLQDYQALLLNDAFDRNISILPQIVLLVLFALPLGLSASYKNFVGGFTAMDVASSNGSFGLTAEPGKQRIGNGLSLLADAYLPFWIDPTFPRTYGFNTLVASNTTAALLDGPLPESVTQLQSTLAAGNTLLVTARVNATVAELSPLSPEERSNSSWWNETYAVYGASFSEFDGGLQYSSNLHSGAFSGILAEQYKLIDDEWYYTYNFSQMFIALWNTTSNETFESTAQRVILTRRLCTGTWNITSSAISLRSGEILEDAATALSATNQSLIQSNPLGLEEFFGPFIAEYDWHDRGGIWNDPLPGTSGFHRNISTVPAFAATITWARQVSFGGPERGSNALWPTLNQYAKTSAEISTRKIVETLKRSAILLLILAIHPILTILAMVGKWFLYSVPIAEGFGVISLLGGVHPGDLRLLKGSALSGELSKPVNPRFDVDNDHDRDKPGGIQLRLGQRGINGKLKKKIKYG